MQTIKCALIILVMLGAGQNAIAKKHTTSVPASAVVTHSPSSSTLGDYYVIPISIPAVVQGKQIYGVRLELRMDISTIESNGFKNPAPLLEVYALKSTLTGPIAPSNYETATGRLKTLALGDNQRVIVDITDIVAAYLASPASNKGIVVGSLTGSRNGLFDLDSGVIAPGVSARITYHYDSRVKMCDS